MKVLFLSITAGQGHLSTAKAVNDLLTARGVECRVVDTYAYLNPVLYETISRGYLMATAITPDAYGRVYRAAEKKRQHDSLHSLTGVANSILSVKLKRLIEEEFRPDVIVCSHIFAAQVVNVMKTRGWIHAPVIGIVTDFTIHPFWQDVTHIEYIVTASELLTLQAVKRGIAREQILPFGIPVNPKFSRSIPKAEARRSLGIDEDRKTVLLMSGSMGYGNLVHTLATIDSLETDFQVLAVCGNNERALRKIERMRTHRPVYKFGFVNNVDLMMDAADCIVTKPGGLTTSEALAKNLPVVMANPIPGQEERNVEFLLNNGMAINTTKTFPVDEALYQLFLYPQRLQSMIENIRLLSKPHATETLCDFIMGLPGRKE